MMKKLVCCLLMLSLLCAGVMAPYAKGETIKIPSEDEVSLASSKVVPVAYTDDYHS